MTKIELQHILLDAYNYHSNLWLDRSKKTYKQKNKKELNDNLIKYHFKKMQEYEKLLQELQAKKEG